MRAILICVAMAFVGPALGAEPATDRVKMLLKGDSYEVTWEAARTVDPKAELEIGNGNGHGFSLGWLRFRPGSDSVDVLSIEFDDSRPPEPPKPLPKWGADRAPVTVKRGRMTPDAYAELLRDLAAVDAAKLKSIKGKSNGTSSFDFWVQARLTAGEVTRIDLEWAGYMGGHAEIDYAKPRVAARLAHASVEGIAFKEGTLTDDERKWASAKFVRDWTKFKGLDFHWWVRERYILMIGVVGDKTALSALRDILAADPPKGKLRSPSDDRCVYYAINAVTRLTKTDVRDKPVEEMDLEKNRRKVLDLLRDKK